MKNRGTYIDFAELGKQRSSFARISKAPWNPLRCMCGRLKADCWDTGESDDNTTGSRKKVKAAKGATANG